MDFSCEQGDKMVTPTIFPHGATFQRSTFQSNVWEESARGTFCQNQMFLYYWKTLKTHISKMIFYFNLMLWAKSYVKKKIDTQIFKY